MTIEELRRDLSEEIELNERILKERAEAINALEAMAEAARCMAESFRMTLKYHNLSMAGHRAAFMRYQRAMAMYNGFRGVERVRVMEEMVDG